LLKENKELLKKIKELEKEVKERYCDVNTECWAMECIRKELAKKILEIKDIEKKRIIEQGGWEEVKKYQAELAKVLKENKDKVKENDDLREQLHKEVFRKLQAQPNALKASEVKPKPLSKQKIEEIVTDWHSDEYGTIESLAEAIYLTQGEEE